MTPFIAQGCDQQGRFDPTIPLTAEQEQTESDSRMFCVVLPIVSLLAVCACWAFVLLLVAVAKAV